jgi:NTP pyrophosphatase (non-canonical NTP hydrolase)
MDIKELTEKMHNFVGSQGWYEPDSPRPQSLRNLAISLNLEAAEVLEHFQWQAQVENPQALADELADVALYLLQLASISGIDLEQAVLRKLEYNYQRKWNAESSQSENKQARAANTNKRYEALRFCT